MALPWLESLPVWGGEAATGAAPPVFPRRFAALFMGNGINPNHWWAKGSGPGMELSKSLQPLAPFKSQAERRLGPVQQARHGRRHPSGPDGQHPLGRGAAEGRGAQGGRQHGPGARRPPRRGDAAAQPRPGLRAADHRLSRDQLLDGLQLAHLLAGRALAGADGGLSVAGLRQPLRQPGEQADAEHPRPRQGACRRAEPPGQPGRPGEARRVSHQRPRGGKAGRAHPRDEGPGRRPGPGPRTPRPRRCRGPTTACPRTSASTCG